MFPVVWPVRYLQPCHRAISTNDMDRSINVESASCLSEPDFTPGVAG